ncbi:MAG: hypothetical protein IT370_35955 [Deltaproteobacteria bacterium]|nr:hypothetical protein [Deltaproteobacteria bacterium]
MRWVAAGVLAAMALWLGLMNWACLVRRWSGKRAPSWIPLVGGVLGLLALTVAPGAPVSRLWWVALLVDGGCVAGWGDVAVAWLRRVR